MQLENVLTLEEIVNYSEGLANDIESGIIDKEGKTNAQLIADLVIHCAEVAVKNNDNKRKITLQDRKDYAESFATMKKAGLTQKI